MKLELYTKAHCSLCDKAQAMIEALRQRQPFALEVHDIRASPSLFERFRYQVPVLALDGEVLLSLRFTDEQLEKALVESGFIPRRVHK